MSNLFWIMENNEGEFDYNELENIFDEEYPKDIEE